LRNEKGHKNLKKNLPADNPLIPGPAGCSGDKKTIEKKTHGIIGMNYSDTVQAEKKNAMAKKSKTSGNSYTDPVPCVMESVPATPGNQKIEKILSDILNKLKRIEEKIDEAVYPPKSAIKPAYVKKIKAIDA
jgi:type VI protein secretion system component VasF